MNDHLDVAHTGILTDVASFLVEVARRVYDLVVDLLPRPFGAHLLLDDGRDGGFL